MIYTVRVMKIAYENIIIEKTETYIVYPMWKLHNKIMNWVITFVVLERGGLPPSDALTRSSRTSADLCIGCVLSRKPSLYSLNKSVAFPPER